MSRAEWSNHRGRRGNGRRHEIEALLVAPGVENVVPIAQPFQAGQPAGKAGAQPCECE